MLELFHEQFVQNAFLAGTLIAIITGVLGYFVVLRAQAFSAESLTDIGFAGATGAVLVGISSLVGMLIFTLLAAFGMGALGKRIKGRDIEVGMILAFALGLGVLFLRIYSSSATETVGVLFGSILSVTPTDVILSLVLGIAVLISLAFIFRPLLFASIDPEVAEARGVPVQLISIVFMLLLAVTVAEAIQVVGILLVFALIIAPAASAQHLTRKPSSAISLSVIFALLFTWGGLILSLLGRFPVSFYIATLSTITYFISIGVSHLIVHPHGLEDIDYREEIELQE
ncbi:MAG: metal ABC transporter permease [Candidatus Levyibacteriota bacterium]|jgi:zinc/manganese transport system permease protein